MEQERRLDAPFVTRLSAFMLDFGIIVLLQFGSEFLFLTLAPFFWPHPSDPVDWVAPQALTLGMLLGTALTLAYVLLSWSPIFGHRSVGKRALRLRVVRESR